MLDDFSDLSDNFDDEEEPGTDSLFSDDDIAFEDLDDYAEYDGSLDDFQSLDEAESTSTARKRSGGSSNLPTFGLSAQQRFVVSFLLFAASCLFSMLCLLLTNRIII
jgi:hypothetical protein